MLIKRVQSGTTKDSVTTSGATPTTDRAKAIIEADEDALERLEEDWNEGTTSGDQRSQLWRFLEEMDSRVPVIVLVVVGGTITTWWWIAVYHFRQGIWVCKRKQGP
jgi:hypothetical protein